MENTTQIHCTAVRKRHLKSSLKLKASVSKFQCVVWNIAGSAAPAGMDQAVGLSTGEFQVPPHWSAKFMGLRNNRDIFVFKGDSVRNNQTLVGSRLSDAKLKINFNKMHAILLSQILTSILGLMGRKERGLSITLQRLIKHLTLYFMISKHSV